MPVALCRPQLVPAGFVQGEGRGAERGAGEGGGEGDRRGVV